MRCDNMYIIVKLIPFVVSTLVMVHHRIKHGYWIDWEDINNHETVALALTTFGLGLLIG